MAGRELRKQVTGSDMKKILIGAAASIALAAADPAIAGDLEPVITPDIVTAPPAFSTFTRRNYNWTGAYAGLAAGASFGHIKWSSVPDDLSGSSGVSGGLIGATVGYNLQTGDPIVLGVEADLSLSGLGKTFPIPACAPSCEFRNPWIITTRLRGGYAFDRILPYLTAGAAFGDLVANTSGAPFGRAYANNLGWVVGIGVEAVIVGPWRVKAEYLHIGLGGLTCISNCGPTGGPIHFDFSADVVRVGANYRIWD